MKTFKLLVAIVIFGFVATEAAAQITKITTSYVSDSAAVLPLWIAKDTGIDLGLPFVHVGLATTRSFVRDNPETVRRYVKSHVEAIHLIKTDRETGIKVLAKYLRSIKDRDILGKTYDGAIPDNKFSRKQYPSMPGLQMALDLLAEENPKAKSARPDDFVDARFIKELDQSGYIDGLYKAKER